MSSCSPATAIAWPTRPLSASPWSSSSAACTARSATRSLRELDRRLDDLTSRGVEVIAVSAETEERTGKLQREWKLDRVALACGLPEEQMRAWGLFVSRGAAEGEPALFSEPALFLIEPDGSVYYESILSMPVGRPRWTT